MVLVEQAEDYLVESEYKELPTSRFHEAEDEDEPMDEHRVLRFFKPSNNHHLLYFQIISLDVEVVEEDEPQAKMDPRPALLVEQAEDVLF